MAIPQPSPQDIADLLTVHWAIREALATDKNVRAENRDAVAAQLTIAYYVSLMAGASP